MIKIELSVGAKHDLDDGYWFYESQEFGLGDYFSSNLKSDIEGLKISASIHRVVYKDYHRLLSKVFPYAIYYTMNCFFCLSNFLHGLSNFLSV
jgi:hypothetical protein